ncbi:MAG TPA: DUF3147 family protein [Acidobacteriaceae bacterium]|nr:DUF3147 family protein [Acidobacteriaceae bacterium]
MKIGFDADSLKENRWSEYAVRFFFGGIITATAAVIAKKFGPQVAGLLLAFPAIFPASATIIEKHEKERMARVGFDGTRRGRSMASIDAAGATMGSLGLIAFGALVWWALPEYPTWEVLVAAGLLWFGVSITVWILRRSLRNLRRRARRKARADRMVG